MLEWYKGRIFVFFYQEEGGGGEGEILVRKNYREQNRVGAIGEKHGATAFDYPGPILDIEKRFWISHPPPQKKNDAQPTRIAQVHALLISKHWDES